MPNQVTRARRREAAALEDMLLPSELLERKISKISKPRAMSYDADPRPPPRPISPPRPPTPDRPAAGDWSPLHATTPASSRSHSPPVAAVTWGSAEERVPLAPPAPPFRARHARPMPMPRVDSGELCLALERVSHIEVAEAELAALSPLARPFDPTSSIAPAAQDPREAAKPGCVTPDLHARSPAPAPPPLTLTPLHPDAARPARTDGRLGGTVVHLSRRPGAQGWYGFVRPDEPILRQQGLCRGDLFLHPSDVAPSQAGSRWQPGVGDRVSFLLGMHNGRLKVVSVERDESDTDDSDSSSDGQ